MQREGISSPSSSIHIRAAWLWICTAAVLLLSALSLFVLWYSEPRAIYLPNNISLHAAQNPSNLPTSQYRVLTPYGIAHKFVAPDGVIIYELRSTSFLRASQCPNIGRQASLGHGACSKIDAIQGNDLYGIIRNDATTVHEQFVDINGTLIAIISSNYNSAFLRAFMIVPKDKIPLYLDANRLCQL